MKNFVFFDKLKNQESNLPPHLQDDVHVCLLDGLEWEVGLAEEDALAHHAPVLHAQVHETRGKVDQVGGENHVESLVKSEFGQKIHNFKMYFLMLMCLTV